MQYEKVIKQLKDLSDPNYIKKLEYYGIETIEAIGLRTPQIKEVAKAYKNNHDLAIELWDSQLHEAKLLSIFIDNPLMVDEQQMEKMLKTFYSWDLVDQACINLFCKHPKAFEKVIEWSERNAEFEKRTAFALIAVLAVHSKKTQDSKFEQFFPIIEKHSIDERNFVKKSINWALRGLGKRSKHLHKLAIQSAENILLFNNSTAKWIANDALKELKSEKVLVRFQN